MFQEIILKRAADFLETVLNRQYSSQPTMPTAHLPGPAAGATGSFVPQTAVVAMNDYVSASTQFGVGSIEKYEASDSGRFAYLGK